MEDKFQLLNKIWLKYFSIMPIQCHEYDKFLNIRAKIKLNDYDFSNCKVDFMDLVDTLGLTIYRYKYNVNQYDETIIDEDYDENYNYVNDEELQCCYHIRKYLYSI